MLSVASSPSIVELPNDRPSTTKSRRITIPDQFDLVFIRLKLSATPNTLIPFLSTWICFSFISSMYISISQEINVCVDSKAKCMDVAIVILSLPVYEANPPIILDHSLI
jgi:hypothetical protein